MQNVESGFLFFIRNLILSSFWIWICAFFKCPVEHDGERFHIIWFVLKLQTDRGTNASLTSVYISYSQNIHA